MVKTFKNLLCVLISCLILLSVIGCGQNNGGNGENNGNNGGGQEETAVIPEASDIFSFSNADFHIKDRKDGAAVEILPEELQTFLDYGSTKQQATFLYNYHNQSSLSKVYLDTSNVTLKWQSTGAASYSIFISDNAAFKNTVTLSSSTNSCGVGFLIPGKTYYYTVVDSLSNHSDVDYLTVSDKYSLRNISAGNAYNMRDIGGYKTEDGKTVKYGMIYRSARFDMLETDSELTRTAKHVILDVLGIKTEIDIRNQTNRPKKTFLGNTITYLECPMAYYSTIIPGFKPPKGYDQQYIYWYTDTLTSIKTVFETFADINNYPIDYHCSAGADRTGTMTFLLNGFLGVSYSDLTCDYELTSFSASGHRWRSNIVDGDFDDTGIMSDVGGWYAFGLFYEDIMRQFGTGDNKLSSAIANYLMSVCKVSEQTLNSIKNIMLI